MVAGRDDGLASSSGWRGRRGSSTWFLGGKYHLSAALVLAAVVTGFAKVLNGFAQSAVSALAEPRELHLGGECWAGCRWSWTAVGAGVAGARWGLPGVIYGVGLGWVMRASVGMFLAARHLRLPATAAGGAIVSADWALSLFRKSVLKQGSIGGSPPDGRSGRPALPRHRRGQRRDQPAAAPPRRPWASADLDEHTVASIRELVGDDVHRLDGARTPFPDRAFDQVVVVDYLEHIPDDRASPWSLRESSGRAGG